MIPPHSNLDFSYSMFFSENGGLAAVLPSAGQKAEQYMAGYVWLLIVSCTEDQILVCGGQRTVEGQRQYVVGTNGNVLLGDVCMNLKQMSARQRKEKGLAMEAKGPWY